MFVSAVIEKTVTDVSYHVCVLKDSHPNFHAVDVSTYHTTLIISAAAATIAANLATLTPDIATTTTTTIATITFCC